MVAKINPFAEPDGTPKKGEEDAFFAFEKRRRKKELENLSKEKSVEKQEAEEALKEKMNS